MTFPGSIRKRRQRGLTLVEVMVALTITLLLTAGVTRIFLDSRQSYRFQESVARMQENGRYALEMIARDARMAGFSGCANLVATNPVIHVAGPPVISYSRNDYLLGLGNVGAGNPFNASAGTDAFTLRMLAAETARVSVAMSGPSDSVTIETAPVGGLSAGEIVAIADCNDVEIFSLQSISGSGPITLTPDATLNKAFREGSNLARFREVSYFVRPGAGGSPALWRRNLEGDTELIEGVADLWVRYGVDTNNDGTADEYREAAAVADWGRIRSLRIGLLMVSEEDNLTDSPQAITFRGDLVEPDDRRLRQVSTMTIGLRNRLP